MTKKEMILRLQMLSRKLGGYPSGASLPELVEAYQQVERWIRHVIKSDANWIWIMVEANVWWEKEDWK